MRKADRSHEQGSLGNNVPKLVKGSWRQEPFLIGGSRSQETQYPEQFRIQFTHAFDRLWEG